jgi:hypothetical protein
MSIDCPRWDDNNDQIKKGGPDSSFRDMSKKNIKNEKKYFFFINLSIIDSKLFRDVSRQHRNIICSIDWALRAQSIELIRFDIEIYHIFVTI